MGSPDTPTQIFLTVPEVAQRLNIDRRSVIRYIETGIAGPGGSRIRLLASINHGAHGQEYRVGLSDLETFERIRAMPAKQRTEQVSGAQLVAGELEMERLHTDVQSLIAMIKEQAEEIETLSQEKGRLEGENEQLKDQLIRERIRNQRGLLARVYVFLFG